jgi:hypothetical protein
MTEHQLKIWPQFFDAVKNGIKTFEYRKDDRGFTLGDTLRLHEWDPKKPNPSIDATGEGGYTGRIVTVAVTYITRGVIVPDGYCVMAIVLVAE